MAGKKLPTGALTAADLADAILRRPPPIGDWVDMDHIFQIDRNLAKQITGLRLETQADVFRAMADGASKAAKLLK
jgi:hypothetical protein